MKKRSVFLLSIIILLAGCQKDIDDNKGKSASKYLPVKLTYYTVFASSVYVNNIVEIEYADNEGNISAISNNGDKEILEYFNGILSAVHHENSEDKSPQLRYANGKVDYIVKYVWYQHVNGGWGMDPDFEGPQFYDAYEPDFGTKIHWKGNQIDYLEQQSFLHGWEPDYTIGWLPGNKYLYNDECQLYKIIPPNNQGTTTTFFYTAHNAWAKDVKNKAVLSLIFPSLFYPACHDFSQVKVSDNVQPAYNYELTYNNEYNDADYPVTIHYTRNNSNNNTVETFMIKVEYMEIN